MSQPNEPNEIVKKKLNDISASLTSDEAILYELTKHADTYNLNNIYTKIYFNETDLSMNSEANIWMNSIVPCRYPSYHCHDCYEFNLIFEGKCIEIVNGSTVILEKGDILILPANCVFHTHYLKNGGRGCNVLVKTSHIVTIRDETSKIVKNSFLDTLLKKNGFCVIHTAVCPDMLKNMEEMVGIFKDEYEKHTTVSLSFPLSKMYVENTFYNMILKIFCELEKGNVICSFSSIVPSTASSEEIIAYIKDNHTSVSMPDLSKKFGYSLSHLSRIIKKHTGSSFSALVTYERTVHAKKLLKNTSLSIAEIAKAVGLDSKEYFCNMFKKQTNTTPAKYRKNEIG